MPAAAAPDVDLDRLVEPALAIAFIVVGAFVANRLLRRGAERGLRGVRASPTVRGEQRIAALASVLRSVISLLVFVVAGLMVLGELGIELAPLLAGAGIVGVALGFGAQSLVKDVVSGVFILVEDQFGVGDVIDLDKQTSGEVEAVSLRTTRLRATDGTVWHVPNGDIRRVGNMSQHWSRALLDIDVAHGTDLDRAKALLTEVAHELAATDAAVLEEPRVEGVERLGPDGIALRLSVKTTPSEQWRVARALRERIATRFTAEGIELPVS